MNTPVKSLLKQHCTPKDLLVCAAIALSIFGFRSVYADWNYIPSGSMEPTLFAGDYVVAEKEYGVQLAYFNTPLGAQTLPQRGDIITFIPPHRDELFIKRVIALPGDHLHMKNGRIAINGQWLTQEVVNETADHIHTRETNGNVSYTTQLTKGAPLLDDEHTLQIPAGKVFVLGDHRNRSSDSRAWGLVDQAHVVGQVNKMALSFAAERTLTDSVLQPVNAL